MPAGRRDHLYTSVPLVVVCSVGRSGTTALRRSLAAHPAADSTGNENNVLHDVLHAGRRNCTEQSRKRQMRVSQPAYDREFRELLLNLLWPEPNAAMAPERLLAFSGLNAGTAQYLGAVFSGARVLYIVRNGIEVVSSRMRWAPFGDLTFDEHCAAWAGEADLVRWGENREDFRLVRHETLRNPATARAALDDVWAWIGLPSHERCAELLLQKRYHPTSFPGEAQAAEADLEQRQDRWRFWTAEQREVFAERCGASMRYFGYDIAWQEREVGEVE